MTPTSLWIIRLKWFPQDHYGTSNVALNSPIIVGDINFLVPTLILIVGIVMGHIDLEPTLNF